MIACPFCEAPDGQPCLDAYGRPRDEYHFTRQLAAEGKLTSPVTTQRTLLKLAEQKGII
jgi:hypothetical protein